MAEGAKPQIGVPMNVRVLLETAEKIDALVAQRCSLNRAEVLRQLITAGLERAAGP